MYGLLEKDEIIQMIISVVAISIALALVFAGRTAPLESPVEFAVFVAPLLITIGSGFVLHEMAHKLVAIYYGAAAKFRMWTQGIIFMLFASLIGVLFAAPGAVYIFSREITKRQNAMISLAGPALNVGLVFFFVALELVAPVNQYYSFLARLGTIFNGFGMVNGMFSVWHFGASINLVLALFNMIPAFPLDGSKVYAWNRFSWVAATAGLLLLGVSIIGIEMVVNFIFLFAIVIIFSKLLFG